MINQAVILAGGRGKRLLPLTKNLPKPMAPVNDIPFLSYLIFELKKRGLKKILILVGFKSEKIIKYFKNHKDISIKFHFSEVKANTGKRLLNASKFLEKEFLLLYGDNYWTPNLVKMYKKFKIKKASISTTVFNNKFGTSEYGRENNVYVKKNSFVSKYDKLRVDKRLNGVDIGFFLIKKEYLKNFQDLDKNYSFEDDILKKAIEHKRLIAYKTNLQYYIITNIKMLKKFEKISKIKRLGHIE